MQTIEQTIDRLYAQPSDHAPKWAIEILQELSEIKRLLTQQSSTQTQHSRPKSKDYYRFVQTLRDRLRADTDAEIYPEVEYHGRAIGANYQGLLYDKQTTRVIPRVEAFAIYDYLYHHRDQLDKLIMD